MFVCLFVLNKGPHFNPCHLGFLCLSHILKGLLSRCCTTAQLQFKSPFLVFILLNFSAALDTADNFLVLESLWVPHFLSTLKTWGTDTEEFVFPVPAFSCALSTPLSLVSHLPEQHLGSIPKLCRLFSVIIFHFLRLSLCFINFSSLAGSELLSVLPPAQARAVTPAFCVGRVVLV